MNPASTAELTTYTVKQLKEYLLSYDSPPRSSNKNFLLSKAISIFKSQRNINPTDSSFAAPKSSFKEIKSAVDIYSPSKNKKENKIKTEYEEAELKKLTCVELVNIVKKDALDYRNYKSTSTLLRINKNELIKMILAPTLENKSENDDSLNLLSNTKFITSPTNKIDKSKSFSNTNRKLLSKSSNSLNRSKSHNKNKSLTKQELEVISSPIKHFSKRRLNSLSELNSTSSQVDNTLNTSPDLGEIESPQKRVLRLPDSPVPKIAPSRNIPIQTKVNEIENNSNNLYDSNNRNINKYFYLILVLLLILGAVSSGPRYTSKVIYFLHSGADRLVIYKNFLLSVAENFKRGEFSLDLDKVDVSRSAPYIIGGLLAVFITKRFIKFRNESYKEEAVKGIKEILVLNDSFEGVPITELWNKYKVFGKDEFEDIVRVVLEDKSFVECKEFIDGEIVLCLKKKDMELIVDSPEKFDLSDLEFR